MDVGIGLPNVISDTSGETMLEWARASEDTGYSSLGTIDRLVYHGYDPLIALSAAAAVTERVRLTTAILIAPYRNTAVLAKQAASLDRLSNGRLTLGVAIGAREDDYAASSTPMAGRGDRFEEQLQEMKAIWEGEERGFAGAIGPEPARAGGPELIVGAMADVAIRRAARYADGWIMGAGGTPEAFAELAAKVDEAWKQEGRTGAPRKLSLAYFSLGPNARENADRAVHHYYEWLGDIAGHIAASVAVTEEMVGQYLAGFEAVGCDELILCPCSNDLAQVSLLAAVAGLNRVSPAA